MIKDHQPIR
ncbi:unnamed protein product [Lathyrus sativus]|nr:unnamed protein product [Lathyrus sativus]